MVGTFLMAVPFQGHAREAGTKSYPPKWQGHIEAEGKWSENRDIGEIGIFLPVAGDNDTLVFTDLRGRFDDNDSHEGNFGLGIRQIMDEKWIAGAYAYYDRRKSPNDNYFNQATIGFEALTPHTEFRINGYLPENEEKSVSTGGGSSAAIATGGQFQIQTTGAAMERPLSGFDIEFGYGGNLSDKFELWGYLGGYYFDADGYDEVKGPRGRIELTYKDFINNGTRLTLGIESQHDDERGEQTFALARLRIPFSSFTGRKPEGLSALDRRMTSRIYRDVDIVTQESAPTVTTELASYSNRAGTQISGYTVVDTNDDVPASVTAAGNNSMIVIDGTAGAVNPAGTISINNGQVVIGGGETVTVTGNNSGINAVITLPGARPTINGAGGASALSLAAGSEIINVDITGGTNGVFVNGNLARISDITISDTTDDSVLVNDADDVIIQNATFIRPNAGVEEAIQIQGNSDDLAITNVDAQDVNIGYLFVGGGTYNNPVFTDVTVDQAENAITTQAGSTINNISGSITATNMTGPSPVCDNDGTMNGSTLTVNGAACP